MARIGASIDEDSAVETLERLGWTAETIDGEVMLHGATLKTWNVLANGQGFDLHFTVPLTEVPNLVAMTPFIQRLVEVKVTRYSRGLRRDEPSDDGVDWLGVDDAE
jgi:hypothetical protein